MKYPEMKDPDWEMDIPVTPMGKPRMTRSDKWAKRKCVQKYYEFKDNIKKYCKKIPDSPRRVDWIAYLPMPKSWSKTKKESQQGRLHQSKPDRDNIDKAILDALFKDDSMVAQGVMEKRWDDGDGARLELRVWK